MALKFDDYIFYHIPKTGGNYTRSILQGLTDNLTELVHPHASPLKVKEHVYEKSFCIVRHPLSWYESFFRYRMATGWRLGQGTQIYKGPHPIDAHCHADSFEGFIQNILRFFPNGWLTGLYLRFVPFCKYVLRQENLDKELNDLLTSFGYKFKYRSPINATSKQINTSLKKETKKKLLSSEKEIIKYLKY